MADFEGENNAVRQRLKFKILNTVVGRTAVVSYCTVVKQSCTCYCYCCIMILLWYLCSVWYWYLIIMYCTRSSQYAIIVLYLIIMMCCTRFHFWRLASLPTNQQTYHDYLLCSTVFFLPIITCQWIIWSRKYKAWFIS